MENLLIDLSAGRSFLQDEAKDPSIWFQLLQTADITSTAQINSLNLVLKAKSQEKIQQKITEYVNFKFENFKVNKFSLNTVDSTWKTMMKLSWNEIYSLTFIKSLHTIMVHEIKEICEGEFDEPVLPKVMNWLESFLIPFAQWIFNNQSNVFINSIVQELQTSALRSFVELRCQRLFEIVFDFPDSLCAIKELKDSVRDSNSLALVGTLLRQALQKRLLHLGASTNQILDFYIAMIKVLRIIDGSDTLLNFVAVPVRNYLLSRSDSIRCIISSLTETKDSDLHSELRQGTSLAYGIDEDDEEIYSSEMLVNWLPAKRVKEFSAEITVSAASRGLDILAMLVSIYGSTDLFIAEYRNLLAEKMIASLTSATSLSGISLTDKELINIELLKKRFGEDSLHSCEIMLKDVEDSRRCNATIAKARSSADTLTTIQPTGTANSAAVTMDMLIISEHYWPNQSTASSVAVVALPSAASDPMHMKLHSSLQSTVDAYCHDYAESKKPRKLTPLTQLGFMEVELTFDDGASRFFKVTPLQGNLIHILADEIEQVKQQSLQSQQQSSLTQTMQTSSSHSAAASVLDIDACTCSLSRLSELSEIEEEEVRNAMRFWIAKTVVRQRKNGQDEIVYELIETQALLAAEEQLRREKKALDEDQADDEDEDTMMMNAPNQSDKNREEMIQQYTETFVRGLLKSHGSLSFDRLQSLLLLMLRAASENGSSQIALSDLEFVSRKSSLLSYLQKLVDKAIIDVDNGMYTEHQGR
jgi:hypothetical protein